MCHVQRHHHVQLPLAAHSLEGRATFWIRDRYELAAKKKKKKETLPRLRRLVHSVPPVAAGRKKKQRNDLDFWRDSTNGVVP